MWKSSSARWWSVSSIAFRPLRIVLFGSRARGGATVESDVDLLVVMSDACERRETAIRIGATLADMPVAKDIIVTTPNEIANRGHVINTVLRSALREGRVIYERP